MPKSFDDFRLLMWKNLMIKWRRPQSTLIEIILPILACFVLCFVVRRGSNQKDGVIYGSFRLDIESPPITAVLWSPCDNPSLSKVMKTVVELMKTEEECFNSSKVLNRALQFSLGAKIVGAEFEDSLAGRDGFPKDLNIRLRFEERAYSDVYYWRTNLLFPMEGTAGPRKSGNEYGGAPKYYEDGFLTLQYLIVMEILKIEGKEGAPQVLMQRFPYPAWVSNPDIKTQINYIILFLLLGFLYSYQNSLISVGVEKESQIKELMKIMGMVTWIHWTAWLCSILLISLISITVVVILLKVLLFYNSTIPFFPLTSGVVLFVFLVLYVSAIVTFAFTVSVFFSRSHTSRIVGGLLYLVSFFPYFSTTYSALPSKMGSCLLPNTALAHGLKLVARYESLQESLSFGNLFSSIPRHESLSMGLVMLMLILDSCIYLITAAYVEAIYPGEYGLPRPWYFPFTKKFWRGDAHDVARINEEDIVHDPTHYEAEPTDKPIGIKVLNLSKKFGKNKLVLKELSLNVFEGHITILLGHKGCGKTTAMSILTGILPPTSGTAIINGYDIRSDMKKIRKSLGFCPQHNALFENLTVAEHLYFFSRLRGLRKAELQHEIDLYLKLLDLSAKKNVKSRKLSPGNKRSLCVGIALCGNSKVCILDEPTAGMDAFDARTMWDVLQAQKQGRIILLSTNEMNEADALGDRIAILANGTLQCYGSILFLKKNYGIGYRLTISKTRDTNVTEITNLLAKYIPTIEVEINTGRELTYILPEQNKPLFESMLGELEKNSQRFKFTSYTISLSTMDEVFTKVGIGYDYSDHSLHVASVSQYILTSGRFVQEAYMKGFQLYRNQLLAMFMKKILITWRSWLLLLLHLILPILCVLLIIHYLSTVAEIRKSLALPLTLDSYDSPITVLATDNSSNKYYQQYKQILTDENREYLELSAEKVIPDVIEKTKESRYDVRRRYIIGATFMNNNTINAWFNNNPYHSPPLALQYVLDAVLKVELGTDYSVHFTNHPSIHNVHTEDEAGETFYANVYCLMVGLCMCYVAPYFVFFCVKERVCRSKLLQLVSGTAISAFWLAAFFWDFNIFLLMSLFIIVVMICFQTSLEFSGFVLLLVLFGFAMLPAMYLLAFCFQRPSSAYAGSNLICVVLGPIAYIMVCLVWPMYFSTNRFDVMHDIFLVVPHYCLISGVHNLTRLFFTRKSCAFVNTLHESFHEQNQTTKYDDYACYAFPDKCCDLKSTSQNGIASHIIYMGVVGTVLIIILLLREYRAFDCFFYKCVNFLNRPPQSEGTNDQDVLDEKHKVRGDQINHRLYDVVLKDVTRYYGSKVAVNQLCLGIKSFECFGLIGAKDAGKTTTIKMMIGKTKLSLGNVWISGHNIRSEMRKVRQGIGYCPETDDLLDELTGKETLIIYCLIRGIAIKHCTLTAKKLAKEFKFFRHIDQTVSQYSGENKRKLSIAIAVIGEPPVIFLDEPTAEMDPGARRLVWNAICRIRDDGKCLILVTSNMDECEAVCTRMAVMANGAFQCLATPHYLKSKYEDDVMLIIKVRVTAEVQSMNDAVGEIHKFVRQNFSKAVRTKGHESLRIYILKETEMSWSKLFGTMERGKGQLRVIEEYSLSAFDLEQIVFLYTQIQKS